VNQFHNKVIINIYNSEKKYPRAHLSAAHTYINSYIWFISNLFFRIFLH